MDRIVATKNKSLQHESERAITRAQTLATQQYSTTRKCLYATPSINRKSLSRLGL
jgi:hypothetical protein